MFQAGWAKHNIGIIPRGYAMHGFGNWHHRAQGEQSPLYARAFWLADKKNHGLIICCLDLGYVTHAMRTGIIERLQQIMGKAFNPEALVLTCTHTHSGPGGCTHDAFYNVVTPGFVPDHLEKVVQAATTAITEAWQSAAPTELSLHSDAFANHTPVAWNRSLKSWNRNPDVQKFEPHQCHLALDRRMQVLAFRRDGQIKALLSLFGVHATCLGNSLRKHDGDNKGYAAAHAEHWLASQGSPDAVAIFAQGSAGDVSPHYHGPGQMARRRTIKGDTEYAYAQHNGEIQSQMALQMASAEGMVLKGSLDAIFSYADFTCQHADPRFANGNHRAFTSDPCHGVAFFTGTPVDGPGMPPILGFLAKPIARGLRLYRLKTRKHGPEFTEYYQQLYDAQGPKAVLMEANRKRILGQPLDKLMLPDFADPLVKEIKRQARAGAINKSAMVPTVLPLQIVRIGSLAIVCCPGEFTSTAGRRVRETVQAVLQEQGISQSLICTYCNDYMGYVTTYEEYQQQAYEGGHTIFGQWTLAAFQTCFEKLAREFGKTESKREHDRITQPQPAPADELALRTRLPIPQ